MNIRLEKAIKWFENRAKEMGLDYIPVSWEVVPEEVMLEIMSYGLPTRARHWSYGQSYDYQKTSGEMGMSKVYELVLNNDPSYAFLLESNNYVDNAMVSAHVIGHSWVFKNNYLFKKTDRKMVYHAAARAQRVDGYIEKYGLEKVEHIMDIALAFEKNIDWNKGTHRSPYPLKKKIIKKRNIGEFDDLSGNKEPDYKETIINENFPPTKEYDILWFIANHANLEPWQKDIIEIIREESFYFYPQYYTKILNEGGACYVHARLMSDAPTDIITSSEFLEFCKTHERVVQPGRSKLDINPYFLGFTILNSIEEEWDQKFKEGSSEITGFQKVTEVISEEDDISFIRTYLTQEIIDSLEMFAYKTYHDKSNDKFIEITSTKQEDVAENIISKIYNYRAPLLYIEKASHDGLEVVHESSNIGTLDAHHTEKIMSYLHEIWGGVINLETKDDDDEIINLTYDEDGFSHKGINFDGQKAP